MDEKEFNSVFGGDIRAEETLYLKKNLNKIDRVIDSYEEKIQKCDEYCQDYRGDYENIDVFQEYYSKKSIYIDKIKKIENLSKSPYFVHMYLEEKSSNEDMFVGYEGIFDENGNNIVYDWRSKVGNLAYSNKNSLTYNGYTYKLLYRRKLTIQNKELKDCIEEYNSNKGNTLITDYYLINILKNRKKTRGFLDIVKSIQANQNDIIRTSINQNIFCQGVAGSGKTVIIVHRLSYLLYNYPDVQASKYLFIAPNNNFKNELSELNIKLGINDIELNTLYEFYINKFNYYLHNIYNKNKYTIKKIIDDEANNIKEIYSIDFLKKKYLIIEGYIYSAMNNIMNVYNFAPNKNMSVKQNIDNLKKMMSQSYDIINLKSQCDMFVSNLDEITKNVLIDEKYIFDLEKYKERIALLTVHFSNLFQKNNIALQELSNNIDFSLSIEKLNDKIKSIKKYNLKLRQKTKKMEWFIFKYLIKEKIFNNKQILDYNDAVINNLSKELKIYKESINSYNLLLKKNEFYKHSLDVLTDSINIVDEMKKLYNKIKNITELSNLSKDLEKISEKFEKIILKINDESQFIEILSTLKSIYVTINFNVDNYILCKNNLEKIKNIFNPEEIIKKIFELVLNNKYSFTDYALKNRSFYRNDIFVTLFILNKLDFDKQNYHKYIFIDEAQDYNDEELILIKELENNPVLNIFGDYKQNISSNSIERKNWDVTQQKLETKFKYFELNENYRNTINVVDYCNNELNSNMYGIGLMGNDINIINELSLIDLSKLAKEKNAIIITNNSQIVHFFENSDIKCYFVFDVKGLEFENIIVVSEGLDENNKYVAYTRTKNDLLIIKKVIF